MLDVEPRIFFYYNFSLYSGLVILGSTSPSNIVDAWMCVWGPGVCAIYCDNVVILCGFSSGYTGGGVVST